jgi:mannose-6-phosphate isomerase-like protein (cupin superfamily)
MKVGRNILLSVSASLAVAGGLAIPVSVLAQGVQPSYKASPDVYKLLAENDQFRVILQTSKPGQRDQWHSHSALATYRLTDCTQRIHLPDGKYTDAVRKRGEVAFLPTVTSHSFENTGKTVCEAVIVERK